MAATDTRLVDPTATYGEQYPTLYGLGLTDQQLACLRRQGYLEFCQRCPDRGGFWKLRYRDQGVLRSRYVGMHPEITAQVRHELALLQTPRRVGRTVKQANRRGRDIVRRVKRQMAPHLEQHGYRFHGWRLRRPRVSCSASLTIGDS